MLTAGDVRMVTRLAQLARSTRNLLITPAAITEKGAGFTSLGDAWVDTTTPHGRLLLTVLGRLAEFERGMTRACVKARSVRLGRRPKLTPHQKRAALSRRTNGEPRTAIARSYNVSHTTISRLTP